jgi:hypothetical protein
MKKRRPRQWQDLLVASIGYENQLTLFVAIAAFGRAFAALGVALFAKGVGFVFVELNFARFGVAVADFAIFKVVLVSFVVEGDVTVFSFDRNDIGGKGGAGGESDEHGGDNEVFHGGFSCVFGERLRGRSAVEKNNSRKLRYCIRHRQEFHSMSIDIYVVSASYISLCRVIKLVNVALNRIDCTL